MQSADRGYAHPEALVSTDWVAAHLDDPTVRLVESDEDPLVYAQGHLPGAARVDWVDDLNDPTCRDYLDRAGFERLMARLGVERGTTLVLYGDRHNWWASYAFWVFELFTHPRLRLMDGGRQKWIDEGRPLDLTVPRRGETVYRAPHRDDRRIRAFREDALTHSLNGKPLIDVRSPEEFAGRCTHMPEYPQEGVLRGGHIAGARNVPWERAIDPERGTFRDAAALRELYVVEAGLRPEDEVITYCRIGERASHTWFVLSHLLGFPRVRNYDGSWTEWGNAVGLPIAR